MTIPQYLADRLEKATLREANEARQKEWDTHGGIDLSFFGNELAGEVGEACNIIKKLERERLGIRGSRASIAQLAEELADVVICADLIAMRVRVELDGAIRAKFNATSIKYGLQTRLASLSRSAPADTARRPIIVLNRWGQLTDRPQVSVGMHSPTGMMSLATENDTDQGRAKVKMFANTLSHITGIPIHNRDNIL